MNKEEEKELAELKARAEKAEATAKELEAKNQALQKAIPKKKEGLEKFNVSSDAKVDYSVEVESLESDKYHKTGDRFKVGARNAKRLADAGKVKIIGKIATMLLFLFASLAVDAQIIASEKSQSGSYLLNMDNTLGSNITRDTVTNTGSGVLVTDRAIVGPGSVTIQCLVTKVSGTVAGTITLTGSIDGTNYVAINTVGSQTAIATATATDVATQRFEWNIAHNPFRYYKITHVGSGTMVSYLDAAIMKH